MSDHWLPLSLTHSLTPCCLVDFVEVALACENANSKLVDVVTVADVDDEFVLATAFCRFGSFGFKL